MSKYRVVVFDLDGTILNTIKDLCMAVNVALKEYNLPLIDEEQAKSYLGYGIRHLITMASKNSEDVEKLLDIFRHYYIKHYNDFTEPYPKINEVFAYCREHNMTIGVLSNKVEIIAKPLCEAHFSNVFSFIYGEIEGRKRKPDPTMILNIKNSLGIEGKEFLYIGDSEVDIEAANNAGVDCLLCTYGFRDKKQLMAKYPNAKMVNQPLDIIKFLI